MTLLEIRVLGYPEIYLDEQLIEGFLSNKVVVLLCYLAINPQVHSRERLAGLFWGDMPETKAKANLRQGLHNLRKILGNHIEITHQTVQFNASELYQVDALQLKNIDSNQDVDINVLEHFIAQYRGAFLEGVSLNVAGELDDWLRYQREHYRLMLLDLLEKLGQTYFAQGEWIAAEKYYRQLVEVEPWQENAHRQIMLCLARQGRFVRAQEHFYTLQDEFFQEFDTNLTAHTCFLREQIQHAQEFSLHQPKFTPKLLIAREDDIENMKRLLFQKHVRLLTIFGMGGVGKTHLARQLMHQVYSAFLHGAVWVDLASRDDLVMAFYDTLTEYNYIPELKQLTTSLHQHILEHIEHYELLIILDNFEHLAEKSEFITHILQETKAIKIVITSRRQVTSQWEYIYHLGGLKWSNTELEFDEVILSGAIQLFTHAAQQIRHDFTLDEKNWVDINRICQLVEGLPLALRLVASWIDHFTPSEIVKQIQINLSTFVSRVQDVPNRHDSISATIAYSLELLNPTERQVLRRLTIFRSGFDLVAATHITETDLVILSHLVNKSLVLIDDGMHQPTRSRYRLHELVRQHLYQELLFYQEDLAWVQQQFSDYYTKFFPTQLENSTKYMNNLELVHVDFDNLYQAWHMVICNDESTELRLLAKWLRYYYGTYEYWRGHHFFQTTLDSLTSDNRFTYILQAYNAFCLLWMGQYKKVSIILKDLRHFAETNQDKEIQAHIYFLTGHLNAYHGDIYEDGINHYKQALELFRNISDSFHTGWCLVELGRTYAIIGRKYDDDISEIPILHSEYVDQSITYLEEARSCFEGIGAQAIGEANILHMIGYINYLWGRDALAKEVEAIPYFQKAIEYFQQVITNTGPFPSRQHQCGTLNWLGIAQVFAKEDILAAKTYIQTVDCSIYYQRLYILMDVLGNIGKFFHRKQLNLQECAKLFAFIEQDPSTDARIRKWATIFLDDTLATLNQYDRSYYLNLIRYETSQDIAEQAKRLLRDFLAQQ